MNARVDRIRQVELAAAVARIESPDPPRPETRVAVTVAIKAYPSAAGVYYGVQLIDLDGSEAEGSVPAMASAGNSFLALHIGTRPPPVGTKVAIHSTDRGWAFSY